MAKKGKKKRGHCKTKYQTIKQRDRLILACFRREINLNTKQRPSKKIYNRKRIRKDIIWN